MPYPIGFASDLVGSTSSFDGQRGGGFSQVYAGQEDLVPALPLIP